MENIKIEYIDIKKLKPYDKNARKHADKDIKAIKASIEEFGFNDPIGIWGDDNIIVEGHGRLLAAKELGIKKVPCFRLDHLTDEQRRAYALAHNKTAELSSWLDDILKTEIENISGIDMTDFGFKMDAKGELFDKYSAEIGTVIYEPKETDHKITELYEMTTKFDKIIENIKNKELKKMLELRKAWFCEFNFAAIADYYAYQATKDEQQAIEALGLVLLDKDQLIENGFSDLIGTVDTLDDYE